TPAPAQRRSPGRAPRLPPGGSGFSTSFRSPLFDDEAIQARSCRIVRRHHEERPMKIGVFATFMSPNATPAMIRDFGKRAEGMGLDSIWMGEHVALFDKNTFGYPGAKDGRIPVPEGGGMLDVTATFGFLAAATKHVRLGTGVALVPQRNPLYTAKEVCTLDRLSDG